MKQTTKRIVWLVAFLGINSIGLSFAGILCRKKRVGV